MDSAVTVAIVMAVSSVVVGYFSLRGVVKAALTKEKTDANAAVLAAWRELNQPLRDENARLLALLEQERGEHDAELADLRDEFERDA